MGEIYNARQGQYDDKISLTCLLSSKITEEGVKHQFRKMAFEVV